MKRRFNIYLVTELLRMPVNKTFIGIGLALIFFLAQRSASAQQPNYQFTPMVGTYTPIVGGTQSILQAVNPGGIFSVTNQGFQNGVPIGFPFIYNNNTYSTVNISTNGYITLGQGFGISSLAQYYINDLSNGPATFTNARPIIAPLWDNIDVQNDSNLTYTTTGTAPNRVFTVQWQNVFWDYLNFNPTISFQLKLYEGTNNIDFVYKTIGTFVGTYSGGASIGLTSISNGSVTFMSLSDFSANPSVSYLQSTNNIATLPISGQTYRFTPLTPCSGVLSGGSTISSVSTSCPYQYFSLSLNGASLEENLQYQWQSKTTSGNWTNLLNDTSIALANAYLSEAAQFRCSITCPASVGSTVYSNPVSILLNSTSCPPDNDEVVGAVGLTHSAYNTAVLGSTFNMTNATASPQPSTFFATQPADDIWYSFVATQDKAVVRFTNVSPVSGIVGGLGFAFYSGTSSNLIDGYGELVALSNGTGESGIITGLTIGSTYYIRLATIGNWTAEGNISVLHPDIDAASLNTCYSTDSLTIDETDSSGWQTLTHGNKLVAAINPQGNVLGTINTNLFINSGGEREDKKGIYYLDRNLEIDPTLQPATPVIVRFYFKSSELNALINQTGSGVESLASLNATMDSASCSDAIFANTTLLTPVGSGVYDSAIDYVDISTPLPLTSTYYLHGGNTALPVIFISFTAEGMQKGNSLLWTIEDESNTKGFEVERSTDGISFIELSYVPSAIATNKYSFVDNFPLAGNNFYRIKLEKADGSFIYSKIEKVINGLLTKFSLDGIYPNPVAGSVLNIALSTPDKALLRLQITDVCGKTLNSETLTTGIGRNNFSLNVSNLAKGTYLVHIDYNNGETIAVQKFVKQ